MIKIGFKNNFYFSYSRDLDEICELMASSKSRLSMGSGIEDLYHSSKLKFDTDTSHIVI